MPKWQSRLTSGNSLWKPGAPGQKTPGRVRCWRGLWQGSLLVLYNALEFLLEQFWAKAGTSSALPEAESFLWISLTHHPQASHPNDKKLELKCEEQRLINNEDNEITRMYIPNRHLNYLRKTGNSNHASRAFNHAPSDEYWWLFLHRYLGKNTFCVGFSPTIIATDSYYCT